MEYAHTEHADKEDDDVPDDDSHHDRQASIGRHGGQYLANDYGIDDAIPQVADELEDRTNLGRPPPEYEPQNDLSSRISTPPASFPNTTYQSAIPAHRAQPSYIKRPERTKHVGYDDQPRRVFERKSIHVWPHHADDHVVAHGIDGDP